MATTAYSSTFGTGNYYRAKCVYTFNANESITHAKLSGTIYLQHKGPAGSAYPDAILYWGAAGVGWNENNSSYVAKDGTDVSMFPAKHTSWTDVESKSFSFSIPKTHAARTIKLYFGGVDTMIIKGMTTLDSVETASFTVPAITSYTITYIASGASSKPANQEKVQGTAITLSNQKPQRDGFTFIKWNTKADGTGTSYNPGATYSQDANLTLYAIWQSAPHIHTFTVIRCDENGNPADEGEYGYVECVWDIDGTAGDTATVTGTVTPQIGGTTTAFTFRQGGSGTGGTAIAIIGSSNGQRIDPDMQYTVTVTVTNQAQIATRNNIITRAFYVMDWKAGGMALGIGRAAPEEGLEVGYDAIFDADVTVLGNSYLELDTEAVSGTDKEIYDALVALGWDSDVLIN